MAKGKAPKLESTVKLEKLYKYLNYEVSSTLLYAGSFFFRLFTPILFIAAIIFTPFMFFVLFKEEKKGWLISFIVMVLIPAILFVTLFPILTIVALIPFYLYCFILRMEVKGWLQEMRARNELALHKFKKANESNEIDDWIVMR